MKYKFLQRLLYRIRKLINPGNIKIEGNCSQCGVCCRNVILYIDEHIISTEEEFTELKTINPQYEMFSPASHNEEGELVFICRYIQEDNTCYIYSHRPKFCKDYPHRYMFLYGGGLYPECGYIKKPSITFKDIYELQKKS